MKEREELGMTPKCGTWYSRVAFIATEETEGPVYLNGL